MQHPIPAPESWRHSSHALLVHAARAEILGWIERRVREHGEPADEQTYLVLDLRSTVGREVAIPALGELEVRRLIDRAARAHAPPPYVVPLSRGSFREALGDIAPVFGHQIADQPAGTVATLVIDRHDVPRVVIATPGLPPLGSV